MRGFVGWGSTVAVVFTGVVLAAPQAAAGATYRPTRFDDPAPGKCKPNDCSLREAILKANDHAGDDTVRLQATDPYELTIPGGSENQGRTGDLDINGPLKTSVHGVGSSQLAIIDANDLDRVLHVRAPSTLRELEITGGDQIPSFGGGVLAETDGTVRIKGSRIEGNHSSRGGGIVLNAGNLTIARSGIFGNAADLFGGGVMNNSHDTLKLVRSTVNGNAAGTVGGGVDSNVSPSKTVIDRSSIAFGEASQGGGIYAFGKVDLVRSTVFLSDAVEGAGVLAAGPQRVRISNTTITMNDAEQGGGGVLHSGKGPLVVNATTVARNTADGEGLGAFDGGGILREGTGEFMLDNTIVALNELGSAGGAPDCSAVVDSGGHNLIGDDAGCDGLVGSDILDEDPLLDDDLEFNGGPTQTIKLLKASPAINEAGKDAPKADQRGHKRGKKPDIGAFER